jgi:hypothetical protein
VDWVKLITNRARVSGVLRVDELACELNTSEAIVGNALRRQEERGLVEHLGKKIFINRLVPDFSGRELHLASSFGPTAEVDLGPTLEVHWTRKWRRCDVFRAEA